MAHLTRTIRWRDGPRDRLPPTESIHIHGFISGYCHTSHQDLRIRRPYLAESHCWDLSWVIYFVGRSIARLVPFGGNDSQSRGEPSFDPALGRLHVEANFDRNSGHRGYPFDFMLLRNLPYVPSRSGFDKRQLLHLFSCERALYRTAGFRSTFLYDSSMALYHL